MPIGDLKPGSQPDSTSPAESAVTAGSIELFSGCMFSGKTTRMLRRLEQAPAHQVAAFKHRRDTRYTDTHIVSHSGLSLPAAVVGSAAEIPERLPACVRLVGIDEAHFFDGALPGVCRALADGGMDVVLTGLDRTSWGRPFPVMESLRRVADAVHALTAVCARCEAAAEFTQRLTPVYNGDIIGGPEAFEPRCAACWRAPQEPPVD